MTYTNKEKHSKINKLSPLNTRKGSIKLTKLGKFICEETDQYNVVNFTNDIDLLYKFENKQEDLNLDYYKILIDKSCKLLKRNSEILMKIHRNTR